ncbi:MAG: GNAT family N-acetyltransferase [Candidatus Marinimicrobia bacterium]|nr:GNAT family N-acetyltransferase [Candidatus Neomarinimicrobiota bacterium]
MTPPIMLPEFQTERLFARPLKKSDIDAMHTLHRNSNVMKYIHKPEETMEETLATYKRVMDYHERNPQFGLWSVLLKDGAYMGWIILKHLDNTADVEIGYRFLPEFWGKGYATEIGYVVRNYGFQELELPTIVGVTLPENIASQRVLEKIGLTYRKPAHYYGVDVSFYQMENPGEDKTTN